MDATNGRNHYYIPVPVFFVLYGPVFCHFFKNRHCYFLLDGNDGSGENPQQIRAFFWVQWGFAGAIACGPGAQDCNMFF